MQQYNSKVYGCFIINFLDSFSLLYIFLFETPASANVNLLTHRNIISMFFYTQSECISAYNLFYHNTFNFLILYSKNHLRQYLRYFLYYKKNKNCIEGAITSIRSSFSFFKNHKLIIF